MNKKLEAEQDTCFTATFNVPHKGKTVQVVSELKDERITEKKILDKLSSLVSKQEKTNDILKGIFTILLWGMGIALLSLWVK